MIIGFTGTRFGMIDAQRATFGTLIVMDLKPTEFRHGSCAGSDVEAAQLVRHIRTDAVRIIAHPGPDGDPWRRDSGVDDETLPPKNHFARNRDIVDSSDLLVACPLEMTHQDRGGTWWTVDFARNRGRTVYLVLPDGSVSVESPS